MSARLSRRSLLAGLAAMPTLAIMGCEDDRTDGCSHQHRGYAQLRQQAPDTRPGGVHRR